jgi:hypothetical protein
MGRKYIKQIINENFIYPNDNVAEYDVEIVQDINNNCVSGTVSNFSATTVASTGITFTYNTTWALNNAEPFIRNSNALAIYSIHCIVPGQSYYKPWRLVQSRASTSIASTTFSETSATFTIRPSQMGVTSFTNGTYYFEFRMIGHRCIFPICANLTISSIPTPTPTPSPTATPVPPTPTPTATSGPSIYTSGATLNVTDTGWIKYTNNSGSTTYFNCTTLGTQVLSDCLDCSTIRDGIPFADLANFSIVNCGTSCAGTPPVTPTLTPTSTGGGTVCRTYVNNSDYMWIGDYVDCTTGNSVYAGSVYPYSSICAVQGSPFTLSGNDLTLSSPCNP